MTVTMPEGTVLIWNEQEGFIVPQYQMCTLEELKQDIENIETIYSEEPVEQ